MPRFAPAMAISDLQKRIVDLAIVNDYEENYGVIDQSNPNFDSIVCTVLEHMPKVWDDWKKVEFSTENVEFEKFDITSGGAPYLLLTVGGDWEWPLMVAIYHDGKNFRGFVPKAGNTYNYKAKSAFGNDEDTDHIESKKQFGVEDYETTSVDMAALTAEIDSRIVAKGIMQAHTKKPKSKAKIKAEAQAALEAGLDLSGDITKDLVHFELSLAADGSYVTLFLRVSGRELTAAETDRVVGLPQNFEKFKNIWYAPRGCYPIQTNEILEKDGWIRHPDNDLSYFKGRQTRVLYI